MHENRVVYQSLWVMKLVHEISKNVIGRDLQDILVLSYLSQMMLEKS